MTNDESDSVPRICVAAFAGSYGVKGDARLKSFTQDPADFTAYGPLSSEDGGRSFEFLRVDPLKPGFFAVRVKGVGTREQAAALKGVRLYVDKAALPPPDEDEFYFDDLVGLKAERMDGRPFGEVRAVLNHGASDLLELQRIPDVNGTHLIPFTKDVVPVVDIAGGRILVEPPAGLIEEDQKRRRKPTDAE